MWVDRGASARHQVALAEDDCVACVKDFETGLKPSAVAGRPRHVDSASKAAVGQPGDARIMRVAVQHSVYPDPGTGSDFSRRQRAGRFVSRQRDLARRE